MSLSHRVFDTPTDRASSCQTYNISFSALGKYIVASILNFRTLVVRRSSVVGPSSSLLLLLPPTGIDLFKYLIAYIATYLREREENAPTSYLLDYMRNNSRTYVDRA